MINSSVLKCHKSATVGCEKEDNDMLQYYKQLRTRPTLFFIKFSYKGKCKTKCSNDELDIKVSVTVSVSQP